MIYTDKPFDYINVGDQINEPSDKEWFVVKKILNYPLNRTLVLEPITV